ncbi:MAG: GNAT family N-acetyltransferase [Candidatus Methanomethylicus sp.]|nr:GNAT family N-acetyltransferase [Candidatus Methanomethylicus sp.]
MQIKAQAISDVEGLRQIEPLWDAFICEMGGCPFLLGGFASQFLKPNSGFIPYILVFSIGRKIVGIVPLKIWEGLFYRKGLILTHPWFRSDFVIDPVQRDTVLKETFSILFRKRGIHFVELRVPSESRDLTVMKKICEELGISSFTWLSMGRAIISVEGTWAQFEKPRRSMRRDVERTGRRMMEKGPLEIKWYGSRDDRQEALDKILLVEKSSWKYVGQPPERFELDPSILHVLDGCAEVSQRFPSFDWGAAILEHRGKPIAHSLFLEHGGHAYICKTSFSDSHRRHSPGFYINYAVVRELWHRPGVKVIDFMGDLPYARRFASEVVPVNKIVLSRNNLGLFFMATNFLHEVITHPTPKFMEMTITYLASILKARIARGAKG